MRSFDDDRGYHWQAALMDASFGNVMVIFSRIGDDGVLKRPLEKATNLQQAEQILADADEPELRAMLAEAKPFQMTA